jgi:CheY-like chemotaxis protein
VGAKTVLLVDGDGDSRTVYRIVLEHHGFRVLEAADGDAALQVAATQDIVALVTELTLRLVDGHTLLRRLRSDPRTRELCVVVVTARALQEDRIRAERAGCTRFLVKPLEPQQLVREIESALGLSGE